MVKVEKKSKTERTWTLPGILPWLLFIGGSIGLLSSFILTIEKFDALANPNFVAVCDLNPIFSCSSVSSSDQASTFGFYNPFLGIAGYAILTTIGGAMLAGAVFKRWFWLAINAGLFFSVAFIHFLIFQTLYRIGALCLFCMIVWAVTIPMFWYITLYNLKEGNLATPAKLKGAAGFAQRHHGDILLIWFLVIIVLIGKRFWYYWSSLI